MYKSIVGVARAASFQPLMPCMLSCGSDIRQRTIPHSGWRVTTGASPPRIPKNLQPSANMPASKASKEPPAPPKRGIQSTTVALSVLKVLIESGRPMYLRELAAGANMATSNVYRYLVSFGEAGMVSQDAVTGRYDLGPLAIQLGLSALRRVDAIDIAIALLGDLVQATKTDGHLCVCGTAGPTVVRWKEGPGDVSVRVKEGHVLPFASSATGRIWATFLPEARLNPLLDKELEALAKQRSISRTVIAREFTRRLQTIRASGISYSRNERRAGIDALCAPVFDRDGQIVLSLTLLSTAYAAEGPPEDLVRILRTTCEDISTRIGCGSVELARYPWLAAAG